MTKKQTGLSAFSVKSQNDDNAAIRNDATASAAPTKGKNESVACTVRLPRAAWLKVQHLALDEGTSFQSLAVAGLDNELKRRGLPGFDD